MQAPVTTAAAVEVVVSMGSAVQTKPWNLTECVERHLGVHTNAMARGPPWSLQDNCLPEC